jgi:ATP-dependent Clp protease ATP-binding subunit ClpA
MLSRDIERILNQSFRDASARRHQFMTVEHLLLGLLDESIAAGVLKACGADMDKLREDLVGFLKTATPLIPEAATDQGTQATLGFQRVLQRAVFDVQARKAKEVTGGDVLIAIFSEKDAQAVVILEQQHITQADVMSHSNYESMDPNDPGSPGRLTQADVMSHSTYEPMDPNEPGSPERHEATDQNSTDYRNLRSVVLKLHTANAELKDRVATSEKRIETLKAEIEEIRKLLDRQ